MCFLWEVLKYENFLASEVVFTFPSFYLMSLIFVLFTHLLPPTQTLMASLCAPTVRVTVASFFPNHLDVL